MPPVYKEMRGDSLGPKPLCELRAKPLGENVERDRLVWVVSTCVCAAL